MQRFRGDESLRAIEFVLYNEREIRLAVYETKNATAGHTGGAPSGHAYIADPTAVQAVRNSVELPMVTLSDNKTLYQPERWLAFVDKLKSWAAKDDVADGVLFDRYHGEPYQRTCYRLNISHGKDTDYLSKIRNHAKVIAAKVEWIEI